MLELLTDPNAWLSLLILTALEIVLGIDNIVFITILASRLPKEQQMRARRLGLLGALFSRILLLFAIGWVVRLESELFHFILPWSGRDLILAGGGLFLLYKATVEIYDNVEHPEMDEEPRTGVGDKTAATLLGVVGQITVLDIVFSLDSVITAVGMAEHLAVMVAAVMIAIGIMMIFAGAIGDFVAENPSIRVLALAFLVLIGVMLIMEATGSHVSKGYIYSAMGFSLGVQLLNIRRGRKLQAKSEAQQAIPEAQEAIPEAPSSPG